MSAATERAEAVGGRLFTPAFWALAALAGLAGVLVAYRFFAGVGSVSAMNDGYPWGTWKILNVIVITSLASGGYATALLVYVFNRGEFHPLVRTALLTSALGYTAGMLALTVDIGRPWNIWNMIVLPGWNFDSVLLEIAMCVSIYLVFLWMEISPAVLERWKNSRMPELRKIAVAATPRLERVFPFIIAFGVLLPTMHQSSLGSLFLLAGKRLHPLWQTPFLPLFFLLSCWVMGFAMVLIVSLLSNLAWKRAMDTTILRKLARVVSGMLFTFVGLRVVLVVDNGLLADAFRLDFFSVLFLSEIVLFTVPAIVLARRSVGLDTRLLFLMAMCTAGAGALYRLNASLLAFMPGEQWSYFPSVAETIITLGLLAIAVLGYLFFVKRFPILEAAVARARRHAA